MNPPMINYLSEYVVSEVVLGVLTADLVMMHCCTIFATHYSLNITSCIITIFKS